MKNETYRINARRDCFVLERLTIKESKDGSKKQIWRPEGFFVNPLQVVLSLRDLKARSIINTGEGNLVDAIKKATDKIIKMLEGGEALPELSIKWADNTEVEADEDEA